MSLVDDYVRVWKEWDDRPTDPTRTNAMISATQHMAEMLDMTHMEFRDRLMSIRKEGRHHEFCVEKVIGEA